MLRVFTFKKLEKLARLTNFAFAVLSLMYSLLGY